MRRSKDTENQAVRFLIWFIILVSCGVLAVSNLNEIFAVVCCVHLRVVKVGVVALRSCARGALALLFVLGATWTFGVLHILNETTLTAYLFTITNAFQGMFIFIFLCVLSRKVTLWLGLYLFILFSAFIYFNISGSDRI